MLAKGPGLVPGKTRLNSTAGHDPERILPLLAQASTLREQPTSGTNAAAAATAAVGTATRPPARNRAAGEAETVMPQLSDTFLERLVSLTRQASDAQYRQKLVDDYRRAINSMIPIAQAVSYQKQVLDQMKSGVVAVPRSDEQTVRAEIDVSTAEVRGLIVKINDCCRAISTHRRSSSRWSARPPRALSGRARWPAWRCTASCCCSWPCRSSSSSVYCITGCGRKRRPHAASALRSRSLRRAEPAERRGQPVRQ